MNDIWLKNRDIIIELFYLILFGLLGILQSQDTDVSKPANRKTGRGFPV